MKKILFLVMIAAIAISSCKKDEEIIKDPVNPGSPTGPTGPAFLLKVSNSKAVGDTIYAPANLVLKFWLDNLPAPTSSFAFTWNIGGTSFTVPEPEKSFAVGVYPISVICTPLNGIGASVTRTATLKIGNDVSYDFTIIPLSATQNGSNWDYAFAMKSTAIYGYSTLSGTPFIYGSFTSNGGNWVQENLTQTQMINDVLYLVYHVYIPVGSGEVSHEWVYGRSGVYSHDPSSAYWVATGTGTGKFRAYFHQGVMSYQSNNVPSLYPGDNGDILIGSNPATVRTSIIYGATDYLRVFINYGAYAANGITPFVKYMYGSNTWQSFGLTLATGYPGWGYHDFDISLLPNHRLIWRFGPTLSQDGVFGIMVNSTYYSIPNNWLAIQLAGTKSSGKTRYTIIK